MYEIEDADKKAKISERKYCTISINDTNNKKVELISKLCRRLACEEREREERKALLV